MRAETRSHEAGFGSNRVSEARGEYVPAPCTHRPSNHPSGVRMRPSCDGRIWAPQGGLSRNKVAVGESAAGSPPNVRDRGFTPAHLGSLGDTVRAPLNHQGDGRGLHATIGSCRSRPSWAHSSVVECLLCKEDAQGSNPCGSMYGTNRAPYTGRRVRPLYDRCTTPCERGWEGWMHAPARSRAFAMKPCVRAIQALTGPVHCAQ